MYVGIDPGMTGAMVAIVNGGQVKYCERFTDFREMGACLEAMQQDELITLCALERVWATPASGRRQGVTGMFNFGCNYGGWKALLEAYTIPYVLPTPQRWQKDIIGAIPKGEAKARVLEYVNARYPALALKKKDSGIADALCLALWARLTHTHNKSALPEDVESPSEFVQSEFDKSGGAL